MNITSRIATIGIHAIRADKPNRALSTTHVRDLVESFGATAFATAVVVRPLAEEGEYKWAPIAGFHRIEAAKRSGQTEVHAIVVEHATDLQIELIEIDENLLHRPLTAVQEARAMARRKAIYQTLNPSTRRGGDRRSKDQIGSLKSFAKATAAATGRSVTAVNRAVTRGDNIGDDALKLVQGTPIETGQFLDRLARVPPNEQKKFVTDELAKANELPKAEPDVEGDLARLRRCWSQTCAEARKNFLNEVTDASVKKPSAKS
jgi:ParB family chromosome partitioning protein